MVWLSRIWSGWRSALAIVRPETVVAWHRKGFRLFWTWKVRHGEPGRPRTLSLGCFFGACGLWIVFALVYYGTRTLVGGFRTVTTACWTILSSSASVPNGRCRTSDLGT